jgi:polyisoprenoid-binding protein YceI
MFTTETTIIPAGTWTVDPAHSTIEFAVKHLGFATIKGRALVIDGVIVGDADGPSVQAAVDAGSLTTHELDRDRHLRTPDFFDVERHPQLTFESTRISEDRGRLAIEGRLTIRGVTQTVLLAGTVTGAGTDPWGGERIGLDVETTIDRRAFGVSWNEALPGGNMLVGNDVRITASVSAVKEA